MLGRAGGLFAAPGAQNGVGTLSLPSALPEALGGPQAPMPTLLHTTFQLLPLGGSSVEGPCAAGYSAQEGCTENR